MESLRQAFVYQQHQPLLFNSVFFIGLFSIFYLLYALLYRQTGLRNALLLAFSLFFYYKFTGIYFILLPVMAAIDFGVGHAIYRTPSESGKKWWLSLSLLVNIGALVYFKYTRFFLESWMQLSGSPVDMGWAPVISLVGLSFFTFKSLSYVIDMQREMLDEPERNYLDYLLYVSLFTNILSGPITKARDLLPQLKISQAVDREQVGAGVFLIVSGIIKKYFIADYLAINFVDRVFASPTLFTGWENLLAVYGGIANIYFDFAGYTDMMLGLSLLMGLRIQENFNRPFLAQNVSDFWRRWHISLSTWFNEYLYLPLSYNWRRLKLWGAVLAVIITFVISGLWHGARNTYVLWGTLHGLAIAWDVISSNMRKGISKGLPASLYRFISIFLTFQFIAFSAVIFKVDTLEKAQEMYHMVFTRFDLQVAGQWIALYWKVFAVLCLAYLLEFSPVSIKTFIRSRFQRLHWSVQAISVFVIILLVYQTYTASVMPFIYMEF